jgi:putative transposase
MGDVKTRKTQSIQYHTANAMSGFVPLCSGTPNAQAQKQATANSWRMDETYIKVRGKWTYRYRAVDRDGKTLYFMLSERRDTASARRFFKRAVGTNGVPDRIAIDKSSANLAGLQSLNVILKFTGTGRIINIVQSKYTPTPELA